MVPATLSPVKPGKSTRRAGRALDSFFAPHSVAVVGATDKSGSVGRTVLLNLLKGPYQDKVYAVNPKRKEVLGAPSYPSISQMPDPVDLAIVVTPATTVPDIIAECVDFGVKSVVVISAGFRERGQEGTQLEERIKAELRRGSTRVIGPKNTSLTEAALRFGWSSSEIWPAAISPWISAWKL